jgi:peptide/nickel transport system substrate-binding protein
MSVASRLALGLSVMLILGCTGPTRTDRETTAGSGVPRQAPPSSRTMNMVVRSEVTDLAPKIPGRASPVVTERLFNAALALMDGDETAQPYLAEALPQLNTDTWQVFADGRMETTYRLRPGLTWHDGQPLTAEDFVFAYHVYVAPELGIFTPTPQDRMDEVIASDSHTLVIRWRSPYPDAGAIIVEDLEPLPRHILEPAFIAVQQDPAARETFVGLRFWTGEYVGAGPYRLDTWVPGSHMEASAFAGHALGRPKIERIMVRFIADENTVLTSVLSGAVDFTASFTLRFEHAQVLQRDWVAAGKGGVFLKRGYAPLYLAQLKREYVDHLGLLDLRVRKALAYSLDRQALNDGLFEGQGFMADTFVPPTSPFFPEVDRTITRYPYDLQRSQQLMAEAGYAKDREQLFANAAGDRFRSDLRVTTGPEFERGQAIMVATWRQAGFQFDSSLVPASQVPTAEDRHTFPGIAFRAGTPERVALSSEIGTPSNRWFGENRGGFANPEYDRLYELYATTLDPTQRGRHYAQMIKVLSDELPMFVTNFALYVNSHAASLVGPTEKSVGTAAERQTLPYWNIHEWELRS